MKAAALILSAGRSSRMGSDKALLEYNGDTFLNRQIFLMLPRVEELVVVLGCRADAIRQTIPKLTALRIVVNENYDRGMLSSLQTGIAAVGGEVDWILFGLVDHPRVRGRTLDRMLETCRRTDAPLVIPRYDGTRGHPTALSRAVAEKLCGLDPSADPRNVIRAHYDEAVFLDVDDRGVVTDIDRPEDYAEMLRRCGRDSNSGAHGVGQLGRR